MTTKTAHPKTNAEAIAQAIAATAESAEVSRQARADADARVRELTADLEQAERERAQLDRQLRSGDSTVNPHDIVLGDAAVTRFRALLDGAKTDLARASRSEIATDLELAESVAAKLEGVVPGVEVFACTSVPSDLPSLPVVIVTQDKPHSIDARGNLSGKVEIVYIRTELHSALDTRTLADALGLGRKPLSRSTTKAGDTESDTFALSLSTVATVPYLPRLPEPREIESVVRSDVRSALAGISTSQGVVVQREEPTPVNVRVLDMGAPEGQTIRARVRVDVDPARSNTDRFRVTNGARRARDAVEALVGRTTDRLGRIHSVSIDSATTDGAAHAVVEATLTLAFRPLPR